MFEKKIRGKVECGICPHQCLLTEGSVGICGVRRNIGGHIKSTVIGKVSALHLDPIEKKPLYHFYPGSQILSIGSFGCNLHCNFCQNWQISQLNPNTPISTQVTSLDEIMEQVNTANGNIGLAYTYNEPTVWFEFMHELAVKVAMAGKKNVMVSNGYINEAPLAILLDYIDAFNIDLKAFDNSFYHHMAGGTLQPVLNALKQIAKTGKHLEITNLIIPRKNTELDKFQDMISWIVNELGPDTVLHLTRYFPSYKQVMPATSELQLAELYQMAREQLPYVYMGNTNAPSNTHCPNCNALIIERKGYHITVVKGFNGACPNCGKSILKNDCC